MELIIKISEDSYKATCRGSMLPSDVENVVQGIKNGTPLPIGHRFIDADEILDHAFIRDDEEGDIFVQKYYCIKKEIMDKALVLFDTLEDKEQNE